MRWVGRRARVLAWRVFLAGALLLMVVTSATAQIAEPIGRFVIDLRGSVVRFGQDPVVASELGVSPDALPSQGLGLDVGGHFYFFRWRAVTFGIGASFHLSRGRSESPTDDPVSSGGPSVERRFRAMAPQLSLNFGTGRGWSYLSGGIAPARFSTVLAGAEAPERTAKTINYGGGARWFAKPHLAFTFDVRFYAISPLPGEPGLPPQPRTTLVVFSAGVAIK